MRVCLSRCLCCCNGLLGVPSVADLGPHMLVCVCVFVRKGSFVRAGCKFSKYAVCSAKLQGEVVMDSKDSKDFFQLKRLTESSTLQIIKVTLLIGILFGFHVWL